MVTPIEIMLSLGSLNDVGIMHFGFQNDFFNSKAIVILTEKLSFYRYHLMCKESSVLIAAKGLKKVQNVNKIRIQKDHRKLEILAICSILIIE